MRHLRFVIQGGHFRIIAFAGGYPYVQAGQFSPESNFSIEY